MERITSRRNPLVAQYRAAAAGDSDALLLDGLHLVQEALDAQLTFRSALVHDVSGGAQEVQRLVALLRERQIRVCTATVDVMDAASPVRSSSPVVALADPLPVSPAAPYAVAAPLVVAACEVQDPGNLGAIIRVAEAAGATGVLAAAGANPFGWKALRGAMGSAFRLPVVRHDTVDSALRDVQQHGCRVVATVVREGSPLFEARLEGPMAIFIGGEGRGLDDVVLRAAVLRVTIPMTPPVESLNAAVAAALVAYECRRRRECPGA